MSNLEKHAENELRLAGFYDSDADYGPGAIPDAVLSVVRTFSADGHSGMSAGLVTSILERVLRFQPLTPLTSDPAEWNDVSEASGHPFWQSCRAPHVFSNDAGLTWYSIEPQLSGVGDKVIDGGEMGTLITCDHCGGSGTLHMLDEEPPFVEPEDS